MKASSIVSRATTTAPGSSSGAVTCSSNRSGYGCSQGRSAGGEGTTVGSAAGTTSGGITRRDRGTKHVEACVGRDPVEPRPEREAPAGTEALAAPPSAQERLLDEVLGVLERAEHPVAVHLQLTAVALDERGERGLLTRVRHRDIIVAHLRAGLR